MRKLTVIVGVTALLLGVAARADVLGYAAGGELKGVLDALTFEVDGVPIMYPRSEVATLEVGEESKDVLTLQDGRTLEGKLVSVRFETEQGLVIKGRKHVGSIQVVEGSKVVRPRPTVSTTPAPKPAAPPPTTPAQQEALAKNLELYKKYMAEADALTKKDIDGFAKKYKREWEQVNREIRRLEESIDRKLRRRRDASRSYTPDRRHRSDYDRLLATDGLDQDQRDLAKARRERSRLEKTLKDQRKGIDDADDTREERIKTVAAANRREILGGVQLTEEEMTRRYDAALSGKTPAKDNASKSRREKGGARDKQD